MGRKLDPRFSKFFNPWDNLAAPCSEGNINRCTHFKNWSQSKRNILNIRGVCNINLLNIHKKIAQRATIAHLSPVCQGQISFQKTYKWAMETRGPKSNLSKLLCLSWLPATLMMIQSKINELAWRHHFPIIIYAKCFRPQEQLTP